FMRLIVFDPFRGAAGDMITGALLHIGADRESTISAMTSVVGEPGISLVERLGIRSVLVKTHATPVRRTFHEVISRVQNARAPDTAIAMAVRVFQRIEQAEKEIHGHTDHFHEVGADDAVAEVVGACTAFLSLHADGCVVLPIMLGGGDISGSHGKYPVPAPATLSILRESGLPVRFGTREDGELCTPTGAALLSEFSSGHSIGNMNWSVASSGYGAGTKNPPHVPNVLRAMIVECTHNAEQDDVDILETNVDDVSAEILAYTFSRLMDEGALDVSAFPCTMKKGRPGHLVRVVAVSGEGKRLAAVMAEELGTLGIRSVPAVHRFTAERSIREIPVTIQGEQRKIRVKCGILDGRIISLKAEYEDVSTLARELRIPARTVARITESQAWSQIGKSK
ncbi:MAG: nickel pincer cofactor biosynthesis protein LarC, partial [Methanoregulaceae archaeon]|nr:nickel pincer cofactor biosynthesis protein LarC [Methanoregulaceae archaeon]